MPESPIVIREWDCRALGRRWPFSLALPEGRPPAGGWPLVLVLHGSGRHHRTVPEAPELSSLIRRQPMALVFPEGAQGWYVDSPVTPSSRFQSMLRELLDTVRAGYPVSPLPRRTAVCGWSMGGFGAVRFAEDCPDSVGAVASIIGLVDFPNPDHPPSSNYPVPSVLGADARFWDRVNGTVGAERLRGKAIGIFAARQAFDYAMNVAFHERLGTLDIAHHYKEEEGGHEWTAVARAFPPMMAFIQQHLCE